LGLGWPRRHDQHVARQLAGYELGRVADEGFREPAPLRADDDELRAAVRGGVDDGLRRGALNGV